MMKNIYEKPEFNITRYASVDTTNANILHSGIINNSNTPSGVGSNTSLKVFDF